MNEIDHSEIGAESSKRGKYISIFILIVFPILLIAYWSYFAIFHPMTIWGVPEDAPLMSLAQAVNIDFWIAQGERAMSQAQFYQPGVYFQFVSWIVYRLTASDITKPAAELFLTDAMNPNLFWLGIKVTALLLALTSFFIIWKRSRFFDWKTLLVAVTIYFACKSATFYGVFMFWNESFSLLIALLFFMMATRILRQPSSPTFKSIIWIGVCTGLLYLHKMNYAVWGMAFLPALFMKNLLEDQLRDRRWIHFAKQACLFIFSFCLSLQIFGRLLLGNVGFGSMIYAHKQIVMNSGVYGNGPRTVINGGVIVESILNLYRSEIFLVILSLALIAIPIFLLAKNRLDRNWLKQNLPEAVLLMAAMSAMILALLKHFQPHYTVSVAAIFPIWIFWIWRAGGKKIIPLLLPIIFVGIYQNVRGQKDQNDYRLKNELETFSDEAEILKMPMRDGEKRLWMYRIIVPTFQRLFTLDFAGMSSLHEKVIQYQGEQWLISPWLSYMLTPQGYKEISDINWRYIVITHDEASAASIQKDKHPWLSDPTVKVTKFKQLSVYENTKLK